MTQLDILEQLERGEILLDQAIVFIAKDVHGKMENDLHNEKDFIENDRLYKNKGNFMTIRVISEKHHFSVPIPLIFIYAGFVVTKAGMRVATYFVREGKVKETSNDLENICDADFMRMLNDVRICKKQDFIQVVKSGKDVRISII